MDEKLKSHQEPIDIESQINNLIEKGLIVQDREYAAKILNDISYFRLIKAYSLTLKPKNKSYYDGVTFESLVNLYLFNANLRQILFSLIERIEINLRCRVTNYFSLKYGNNGYKNAEHFQIRKFHKRTMEEIERELRRNSRSPFVKNFRENYEDGEIPLYAAIELFSFGTLSKFYKNMKSEDKKAIAETFGVKYIYLESWIENFAYVRNICAHYGRLYNEKFAKAPTLYKEYMSKSIPNNRVFSTIINIGILQKDTKFQEAVFEIEKLIEKYPDVEEKTMGFPENWKELLRDI